MALYGSSIPLDGGGFVTTVICPNHYSHQRLMCALNEIVPSAGQSTPPRAPVQDYGNPITPIVLEGDQILGPSCGPAGCGED